jgi:outer membrane protein assembly factor BamB
MFYMNVLLYCTCVYEKIFKGDAGYYHWGIKMIQSSEWKFMVILIFLIIWCPLTNSSIIKTDDGVEFDYQRLVIPEYFQNWYTYGNNSVISETINLHNLQQKKLSTVEPYNNRETNSEGRPMNSAWPMLSYDIRHTGRSPYNTTNNMGAELWRVSGMESGAVWSSAIIDNNATIYFGNMGSDGSLYALYPNGARKWRYLTKGIIWDTPAIADDGTLYFTTWGSYHYFYAVNSNGTTKWLFAPDGSSTSSPTIGCDGTIYFGDDNHIIYAINPDGTQKWRYTTGYIVMGSPAIDQVGTIYIGSGDHYLYALNPNGTLRWRLATGSEIKGSASIAPDGTIYVPSFDGFLYAVYPNGTMKWKASTGSSIASAGVALATDGTIYVGTEQLRAYYPNGTLKWMTNVQGSIYGTVPALSADGTIYVSAGGSLVAVNPDGTERWRKQLTIAQIRSSPSIGPDDRVYVGSEDYGIDPYGYLHAFGLGSLRAEAGGPYSGLASHTPTQFFGIVFGGQPPYTYSWDFGDGNTSDELEPIHLYRNFDTYNVTFTVTDHEGNYSIDTTTAIISYGPPQVSITRPESAIYLANLKLFSFQYPLVFGKITIEVEVTHPFLPIERVEFYKWDQLQTTDTTPPYTWTWSERIPLMGTHKVGITVFAYTSETYGYGYKEVTKFF